MLSFEMCWTVVASVQKILLKPSAISDSHKFLNRWTVLSDHLNSSKIIKGFCGSLCAVMSKLSVGQPNGQVVCKISSLILIFPRTQKNYLSVVSPIQSIKPSISSTFLKFGVCQFWWQKAMIYILHFVQNSQIFLFLKMKKIRTQRIGYAIHPSLFFSRGWNNHIW